MLLNKQKTRKRKDNVIDNCKVGEFYAKFTRNSVIYRDQSDVSKEAVEFAKQEWNWNNLFYFVHIALKSEVVI